MNRTAMSLHVLQEYTPEGTRRILQLANLRDQKNPLEIFFDMVGDHQAPLPRVLDGFVFAILFYAMQLGQDIQVHGTMSGDALRNLNEFQEAWVLWRPQLYQKIQVIPDEVTDRSNPSREGAVAAFSGGVDSIFTLLRHGTKQFGAASYPLKKTALMVHGFDVPLNKPEQFESLQRRTEPLLSELGVELKTIRTNLKELELQGWEDSSMTQLAGCLHNYSHQFSYGLVGSTESYDALILPWGSNPATDHLLSGAALSIIHDGAGYSRTAKVEQIARHATAASVVKVCWEGQETSKNCGECEKCVRTLLNFLAVGVSNPPCFSKPLDKRQIRALILRNDTVHGELKSIVNYAKAKGITEDWLLELDKRVKKYKGPTFIQKHAPRLQKAWALAQRREWHQLAGKVKMKALGDRAA